MTTISSTASTSTTNSSLLSASTSATPLQNIGGLASGLDTNSIITQLLAIERQPEVQMQRKQSVEQYRLDSLTAINTQLVKLQSSAWSLRDVTLWGDTQTVTSSDPANLSAVRTSGAAAGGYTIQVKQLARADQVKQTTALASVAANDTLHIAVGTATAVDVPVQAGDTLDSVAAKINGASGIGVYASVVSGKLVLSGRTTGLANTIAVTSDNGLHAQLGFTETVSPRDAKYSLDDVDQPDSASNTVSTAIPGVTLTFTGVMASPATLNVGSPAPDTTKIAAKVQDFVTVYNATVDLISSKVNEARVANPQSSAEITQGALAGDSGLSSLLSNLRQSVTGLFSGRPSGMSTLAQAGLSTGAAVGSGAISADSLEGKLTLDTTKLTTALQTSFTDVKALFTNFTGDATTEGLSQRLDDVVTPQVRVGGIMAGRVAAERASIKDLTKQQSDVEARVTLHEQALRMQFTAMETAMAQSQALQAQLTSQIAGLSNSG